MPEGRFELRVKPPKNEVAAQWCEQMMKGEVPVFDAYNPEALLWLLHIEHCPVCRGDV